MQRKRPHSTARHGQPLPPNSTDPKRDPDRKLPFDIDDDCELDDPSELDEFDLDDRRWEAFLADDDELDPEPEPGDFWNDSDNG